MALIEAVRWRVRGVTLWRTTDAAQPWLGKGSYWARARSHAKSYSGFSRIESQVGLYRLCCRPRRVLDLRSDPWGELRRRVGVDVSTTRRKVFGHNLIQAAAPKIVEAGFLWVVHRAFGVDRDDVDPRRPEEWMYLGDEVLKAVLVDQWPNDGWLRVP